MTGAGTHIAVPITLKDGTAALLRAPRPDDRPRIRQAFEGLSAETIHTRFFGAKTMVSEAELQRITDADFVRDIALLVTIGTGEQERIIGGAAAYAIDAETPPRRAELAFTIEEDFQGRGMAAILMRHLAALARRNGVRQFEADVLWGNLPMLAVFRGSGLPMTLRHEGDTVHVTLSLGG